VTNLGIQMLYYDQLAKNDELEWSYSDGIEGISQRARMLHGDEDYDAPVIVKWPYPLPQDPSEQTKNVGAQQEMGLMSKRTGAEKLGLNWQQEQERMAEDGDSDADAMERLITQGGAE